MEIHDNQLHKLAKNHKKAFEKYIINPGGCLINTREFYWVNYFRFGKMVGHAVISSSTEVEMDEYQEAFNYLAKSSQLRSNFTDHGSFRAGINMDSFKEMLDLLETIIHEAILENDRNIVKECSKAIQRILKLQDRLVEIFNEFYEKERKIQIGEVKIVTSDYLEFTYNCTCEIDYIRFTQFNLHYDAIPHLEYLRKMTTTNSTIKKYANHEVKVYFNELIKSKSSLEKNIKELSLTSDPTERLTKEKHMELTGRVLLKSIQDVTNEAIKDLRFPKFI